MYQYLQLSIGYMCACVLGGVGGVGGGRGRCCKGQCFLQMTFTEDVKTAPGCVSGVSKRTLSRYTL